MRKKFGYSFQNAALFDSLTVAENLEYPLRELTDISTDARQKAMHDMLGRIGMPDIAQLHPAELSGGMQKRVGMARALMRRSRKPNKKPVKLIPHRPPPGKENPSICSPPEHCAFLENRRCFLSS